MGMSASQARLLSLTARMHDMEFQAQALQYTKLDLINSKDAVYNEYLDAMDSTKLQMAVVTPTGKQFQDITYTNMIMSNAGAAHSMYIITNMRTGQVLLPEQVASKLGNDPNHADPLKESINPLHDDNTPKTDAEMLKEYLILVAKERVFPNGKDDNDEPLTSDDAYYEALVAKDGGKVLNYWTNMYEAKFPKTEEDFLLIVAKNYLYTGRTDLESTSDYLNEMRKDGNYDYWRAVYYQITGYEDDNGNFVIGRGFCPISAENASDRDWLQDALNSGNVELYKLTNEQVDLSYVNSKTNIFAKTSVAIDTELAEAANDEIIRQAEVKYEKAMKDIDEKETKLDLKLAQIDTQHNALKTEYDSVKQIVSKNIDRSFKTFNASIVLVFRFVLISKCP